MMKRPLSLIFFIGCLQAHSQTFTSATSGNWGAILTWAHISLSYPQTGDDATVSTLTSVSVNGSQQCNEVTVDGTLNLASGDALVLESILDLNSTGTINNQGIIECVHVAYDGTLNNSNGGYLEVTGNVAANASTRIVTNDGSLIIYGGLAFD